MGSQGDHSTLYHWIRPVLFHQDPETIHEQTLWMLHHVFKVPGVRQVFELVYGSDHSALQIEVWGKTFPNPIGIAAGFDKNGMVYNPLFALGFGFVEIGTVTPLAQPGNPRPRLFRLPEDQALINRLGFNNQGVGALIQRVMTTPPNGILGINIGKNKETPIEQAHQDYEHALQTIYDHAEYIVINVSSPNTENLRTLQEKEALHRLLSQLLKIRQALVLQGKPKKILLLKIAPDLTDETFDDLVTIIQEFALDGVIATNTTLQREALIHSNASAQPGGLSGASLRALSTKMIGKLYHRFGQSLPIIGVGGVFTGKDAYEKIRAGASLIQIYTGMIYRGPAIVKLIKHELLDLLREDGFSSVSEAVGADFR